MTDQSEIAEAIFGAFDGVTSVTGVIAGAVISGHQSAVPVAGVSLALAEGVSMAGASYLAAHGNRKTAIMAGSVVVSILLPVVPFLVLANAGAIGLSLAATVAMALLIANLKTDAPRAVAHAQTFGIISVAIALTVAAGTVMR